jgi:hypothetical protein
MRKMLHYSVLILLILSQKTLAETDSKATDSTETQNQNQNTSDDSLTTTVTKGIKQQSPHTLVEEFTADTLANNEWKIGTELDFGLTDDLMIGTDLVALVVGVPTFQFKYYSFQEKNHHIAFGMRLAYFNKKTFLWGDTKKHWDTLSGEVYRPSVSWTHKLSKRLNVHTFWAKGLGKINAELSPTGKRKLCETKYPNADCAEITASTNADSDQIDQPNNTDIGQDADQDGQADDVNSDKNLETSESASSPFSQSIPVQSITGFAQDRFQITGEIKRTNGNKIFVTARIEQTSLEELEANFFRLTIAHQWIWDSFQMKIGVGTQYFVMTGKDLDGVLVDDSGVQPASDIGFYWRF